MYRIEPNNARVKHWSIVSFTLANKNNTVHIYRFQHGTQGIYGGLIAGFFIAQPHLAGGCQRGGFRNAHYFHSQVSIGYYGQKLLLK